MMVVCLDKPTNSPVSPRFHVLSASITSLLLVGSKARQPQDNDISYDQKKNSEDLLDKYGC